MSEWASKSVRELKAELKARGISIVDCVEKSDLVEKLVSSDRSQEQEEMVDTTIHEQGVEPIMSPEDIIQVINVLKQDAMTEVKNTDDDDDSEEIEPPEDDGIEPKLLSRDELIANVREVFAWWGVDYSTPPRTQRILQWYACNYPPIHNIDHVRPLLKGIKLTGALKRPAYCLYLDWDPEMIDQSCWYGYFPMATPIQEKPVMLIKSHETRCALVLEDLYVEKNARRKSKKYEMSINKAFDDVVKAIQDQHGFNWMYPELAASFKIMHLANGSGRFKTDIHSIELWKTQEDGTRKLIAGELGYADGAIYTSLTGFCLKEKQYSGAGTIQLCALARLLQRCGFLIQDFGMYMKYKVGLGAKVFTRMHFLSLQKMCRVQPVSLSLEGYECANDIIMSKSTMQ